MPRTVDHNVVDYILKNVPGELWDRAKAKAAASTPPLTLRWVLISLLERWAPVDGVVQPPKKLRALPTKRTPKSRTPDVLDLGNRF